jgi:hypothetical protein
MNPIWTNVGALAVAVIYYVWRAYDQVHARRHRTLRERVAYMLWVMADQQASQRKTVTCN